MQGMKRRKLISTSAGILGATLLPKVSASAVLPSRSGLPWASGARDVNPDGFVAMRDRQLDVLMTFGAHGTWTAIRNRATAMASLLDENRGNRQETIVVTYPIFPDNESPLTGGPAVWMAAARGEFDEHHKATADGLKRFSQKFIFRPGHEWNCCFAWRCLTFDMSTYYKDYFRRIVDILRERHPTCLIDWCSVKRGKTDVGLHNFYPGRDWVDFIGHDKYDMFPPLLDAARWNSDYAVQRKGAPVGIGAWLAYAKSRGKKLAVSEWAVSNGPADGGGDNAYFVKRMLQFFAANAADIAYESYFNRNNTNLGWDHLLEPGHNPLARSAYQSFFATRG